MEMIFTLRKNKTRDGVVIINIFYVKFLSRRTSFGQSSVEIYLTNISKSEERLSDGVCFALVR